jgi:hypothetical protein
MTTKVVPIGGGNRLHVPAHLRGKTPSGEIEILRRMVLLANAKERRLVLTFPDKGVGYVISSPRELRGLIERLEAVEAELFNEGGRNMAQALRKDITG